MFRMLSSILRRKSNAKCKTYIKLTKTRLLNIKKRRSAVEKYLKDDLAELLRSGYDTNAYGKAERLLVEKKISSCYDMIEQFCDCVSEHLPAMSKERECPEECREAMSSLSYAAAWIADLPELRDLRSFFNLKYGNSIESYVNKEFVEKLRTQPPSREIKLKLMNEVAQEFSIEWDPKALEQKLLGRLPSSQQVQQDLQHTDDSDNEHLKSNKDRKISTYAMPAISSEDDAATISSMDSSDQEGHKSSSSISSVSEDDADLKRPNYYRFIPPPYTKQNKEKENVKEPNEKREEIDVKAQPRSVRKRHSKLSPGQKIDIEEPAAADASHNVRHRSKPEGLTPATRAVSLPTNGPGHRKLSENSRAASFQPELLSKHVHPKLPEYDDLPSRLAALKGK